jgi:hypothetical protein
VKRLFALCVLAGCASLTPGPEHIRRELEADKRQLAREEQALAGAVVEGRPVDCPRAGQLSDNVCALAERICALVDRLPRSPENTALCTDARARCAAARQRVKASCPK